MLKKGTETENSHPDTTQNTTYQKKTVKVNDVKLICHFLLIQQTEIIKINKKYRERSLQIIYLYEILPKLYKKGREKREKEIRKTERESKKERKSKGKRKKEI